MQLLEPILGKKNNIKIIRYLLAHKDWEFNITEFSKDTNINKGILSRLINDLEKQRILNVKRKGKIKLFSLNKDNLFIKEAVVPLFEKESSFFEYHLKKEFVDRIKGRNIVSVVLYGSVASGRAKLTSDIDTLIIIKKKDEKLKKRTENIIKKFLDYDFLLRADILTESEFKKLYKRKEPFIMNIIKKHKVLYGKSISEPYG